MINAKTRVEIECCREAFVAGDFNQNSIRRAISAKDVGGRLKRLKHLTAKERVRPLARCFVSDA